MASLNTAARNNLADHIATAYGTATLTILDGVTVLAAHTLTGFGAAVNGVITANAIASVTIAANGTATSATLTQGGRTITLSIGTSGTEVIVSALGYALGGTSSITSLTITYPAS